MAKELAAVSVRTLRFNVISALCPESAGASVVTIPVCKVCATLCGAAPLITRVQGIETVEEKCCFEAAARVTPLIRCNLSIICHRVSWGWPSCTVPARCTSAARMRTNRRPLARATAYATCACVVGGFPCRTFGTALRSASGRDCSRLAQHTLIHANSSIRSSSTWRSVASRAVRSVWTGQACCG
jgi:hypothetical protein